jgi:hypothetical protein
VVGAGMRAAPGCRRFRAASRRWLGSRVGPPAADYQARGAHQRHLVPGEAGVRARDGSATKPFVSQTARQHLARLGFAVRRRPLSCGATASGPEASGRCSHEATVPRDRPEEEVRAAMRLHKLWMDQAPHPPKAVA